jgi:hypothetical protein
MALEEAPPPTTHGLDTPCEETPPRREHTPPRGDCSPTLHPDHQHDAHLLIPAAPPRHKRE